MTKSCPLGCVQKLHYVAVIHHLTLGTELTFILSAPSQRLGLWCCTYCLDLARSYAGKQPPSALIQSLA